jgi:hypothetical protein
MDRAHLRLQQEIVRLGGDCAHVLNEQIELRHDDHTGEVWLYGRFEYELYRRSARKQPANVSKDARPPGACRGPV